MAEEAPKMQRATNGPSSNGGIKEPFRWQFHAVVLLFVIVGMTIVAIAETRSPFWKDIGLVVGGALIGFVSLSIDEHFRSRPERARARREREEERREHENERAADGRRAEELLSENQKLLAQVGAVQTIIEQQERREFLLSRAQTNGAYYLGHLATSLPTTSNPASQLPFVRTLCNDIGLQFSEQERAMLSSEQLDNDSAEKISATVLAKISSIQPVLRCFFSLGNISAWLRAQVSDGGYCKPVVEQLERLIRDPFLALDPQYYRLTEKLLAIVHPYIDDIPDEGRELLKDEVAKALAEVPPIYIHGENTRRPVRSSEWFYVTEEDGSPLLMRIVDKRAILRRDLDTYDIVSTDEPEQKVRVTRSGSAWRCSAHVKANEREACVDIQLVLDATHGGKPVEAGMVVGVKKDS